jgi:hypothetical protein
MDWTGRRNWALYALMVHLPCCGRNLALVLWCRCRPHRRWSFTVFYIVMHWLQKLFLQDKSAMDTAVQAVNFIWSRALNHRLFKIFCEEVGAAHEVLLYHTEVRWLSHGRVFTRVMELRTEIAMFLREKETNSVKNLKPKVLLCHWPILKVYSRI